MNITEFLLARIAEDEAVAKAAWCDSPWVAHERWHDIRGGRSFNTFAVMDRQREVTIVSMGGTARHIAHWHPTRVLAECAAKRAIVEMYEGATKAAETLGVMRADEAWAIAQAAAVATEGALRALAAVYADHPDYDQAWRV